MSDFIIENGVLERYCGTEARVVIPEGVTAIGGDAFRKNNGLVSGKIPEGVKRVDGFGYCKNLTSV